MRTATRAWRPAVPGVAEVFHASFADHAYPAHTHDTWTLLLVDAGAVSYDLDRHRHGALPSLVTLLPPHVPHDGRAASPAGFRKRVLYLDVGVLGADLAGRAVDAPGMRDPVLRDRVSRLHAALSTPDAQLESESRLARAFTAAYGLPPHRYLTGRRVDLARRLLLDGVPPAEVAARAGFYDQSHLARHFGRMLATTPSRYRAGRP